MANPENTAAEVERAEGGKFAPGKSGNPGGRPKGLSEVIELARKHTVTSIAGLASIANDESMPPSARVAAHNSLLERGWGKPVQPTMEQDENGKAIGRQPVIFAVLKG